MKKLITLFFAVAATIQITYGQYTLDQLLKAGDQAMAEGNYYGALSNFGQAVETGDVADDVWFKYGQAAIKQNAYSTAETAFTHYIENTDADERAKAIAGLADAQMMLGNYTSATDNYNVFLSEYSDLDPELTNRVNSALKSTEWALAQPTENPDVTVNNMGSEVNTGYSEHGPYVIDDQLYFSSLRYPYGTKKNGTLISKILKKDTSSSEALAQIENFNSDELLTSNPTFNQDGALMIYSVCRYGEQDDIKCSLYAADRLEDGVYGNERILPASVNMAGATTTQPNIKTTDEGMVLFYSSDAIGGKGKMDIWSVKFDNNLEFGIPENLAINTTGDDITPFYHNPSNTLYFSSNGRAGFGNFDLFKRTESGVENLGAEYNTSYNDIYFYLNDNGTEAYLSSNRKGSLFLDDSFEACCYDIYKADIDSKELDLLALIYDGSTGEDLSGARVILTDLLTGEVIYDSLNPEGNDYTAKIRCDKEYELTVYRDGYSDHSQILGPYLDDCGKGSVTEKISMYPATLELVVNTFDKNSNGALNNTNVELICVATGVKANKNTSAQNTVTFMLDKACPEYRVVGSKAGYEGTSLSFTTDGLSGSISKDLYLGRSQAIATLKGLIPARLYFDNDNPNPKTTQVTTSLTYSETYNKYYPKKNEFGSAYANRGGNSSEVFSHFDNEVKLGYDNLQLMLSKLLEVLKTGQAVNLYIRGYASPLAASEYNTALGRRRVDSVRNELKRWNGGVLSIYLKNGLLSLTERSFGEETASGNVSDDPGNRSKSVYSPDASRERRVEIDEIKFDNQ